MLFVNIVPSFKILHKENYDAEGVNDKPYTHLHPAPSTSTQLILTSTQLHPPPPISFQFPPSSLQHPQQYLDQNIARNWAISQI